MAFSAGSSLSHSIPEINVTPLIDVLLVLLILFMVIVPVRPRGLDSQVPQGLSTAGLQEGPVSVRILAEPSGALAYEVAGRRVARAEVDAALVSALSARADRELFVAASAQVSYQAVAQLIGEARAAGAGAIVLERLEPRG